MKSNLFASGPNGPPGGGAPRKLAEGVPLGQVIPRELVPHPDLVLLGAPRSIAAERFRRLKTLLLNDPEGAPQVIVVTSSMPAEGKSMVAMNLALAYSLDRAGDVLLMDADLRRPSVNRWLNPAPSLGVTEVLRGETGLEHALMDLKNAPLKVFPAGKIAKDPVELLSSAALGPLMKSLRERFVRIIIDTPPILAFTDADAVGRHADGTLMVVRAGATPVSLYTQAIQSVTSTRILGAVLNDTTFNLADRSSYYYGYYEKYYGKHYGEEHPPGPKAADEGKGA